MSKTRKLLLSVIALISVGAAAFAFAHKDEILWAAGHAPFLRHFFKPSVESAVQRYGEGARTRLQKTFEKRQVQYPPTAVIFVALKKERRLLVYASSSDNIWKFISSYPILGASGNLGPKLREGDFQVPEGLYQLSLEPDTPYHVALRLNYPNAYDLEKAKADNRLKPGSDILIHGTRGSIGCIAVGDPGSEDLFVLAYDTHNKNLPLIIAPNDLRVSQPPEPKFKDPKWLAELYSNIKAELQKLTLETQ